MDEITNMTVAQIIAELEQRMAADEQAMTPDEAQAHAERMDALTAELEQRNQQAEQRTARIDAARSAIESGNANRVDAVPLNSRTAGGMQFNGQIEDVTDYGRYERSAYFKDLAARSGLVIPNMEMNQQERAAFTHLTSNTGSVVPTETQNQIISLIDSSATLFGDVHRDNFAHVYEIPRHTGITTGDAAKTNEGAAPANDEQNGFDVVTINGDEIKKTVKMSRKMQVQSIAAFESYIINETAGRLAHAAELMIIDTLDDATLGMAAANKISITGTSAKLTKAKLVEGMGKLKTFNNPAPKGAIVYANGTTIWNSIAMVEDANNRSFFIQSEQTDDPTVQGRVFGKVVKQDDALADNVILIGYPDLFRSNLFDGISVDPYIERGTQLRCWDGYMLYGGALAVPVAFSKITIGA